MATSNFATVPCLLSSYLSALLGSQVLQLLLLTYLGLQQNANLYILKSQPNIALHSKRQNVGCACRRQAQVKAAMQHAWGSYVTYAFGHDELMPRSLRGKDPFGGLGATILDSLDTLWLMGMKAEYQQARDWVAHDLNFTRYGLACC